MNWWDRWRINMMPCHQKDVILTGIPRSGTTMMCKLLSDEPNSIALNEPIKLGRSRSEKEIFQKTKYFLHHTRKSLIQEGWAYTKASEQGLTTNHFADKGKEGKRTKLISRRKVHFDKPLTPDFMLSVKHNAAFTIALDRLRGSYRVYATVRNPLSVLLSWNSVEIPVSKGRLRKNLHRLLPRDERMNSDNLYERQVGLLDWYFTTYRALPSDQVLRYEDIVDTDGKALGVVIEGEMIKNHDLQSRNKNKNYDDDLKGRLKESLETFGEACWQYYDQENVTK